VELDEVVKQLRGFSGWQHPEKYMALGWYLHRFKDKSRFDVSDLKECYILLHTPLPANPGLVAKRLTEKKPPVFLVDGKGYSLERRTRERFDERYGHISSALVEVGQSLIPDSLLGNARACVVSLARQINGTYKFAFYDACAVLSRRIVETALIEKFSREGFDDKIRSNGEYQQFSGIISVVNSKQFLKLSKGSDKHLELIKDIGDRAAHHRSYVTTKHDIDLIAPKLRALLTELL